MRSAVPKVKKRRALGGNMMHGLLLMTCLGLFLVVCKLYLDQYIEIRRLEERRVSRAQELQKRKVLLDSLEHEVEFIGTLEGVEKMAREKLKYIKTDEVIILPVEQ